MTEIGHQNKTYNLCAFLMYVWVCGCVCVWVSVFVWGYFYMCACFVAKK